MEIAELMKSVVTACKTTAHTKAALEQRPQWNRSQNIPQEFEPSQMHCHQAAGSIETQSEELRKRTPLAIANWLAA
jgi:hypothetical protein